MAGGFGIALFMGEEYQYPMEEIFRAQVEEKSIHLKILKSRLDAASVGRFKEHIAEVWTKGLERADIDMADVEFIDSSGIGALLSVYRRFPKGANTVSLTGMRPQVQAVIELLRLHRIFQVQA